jgi:hypothetical protein
MRYAQGKGDRIQFHPPALTLTLTLKIPTLSLTIISNALSLLKSPTFTYCGLLLLPTPVEYVRKVPKLPFLYPYSTTILLVPLFATATSNCSSLLKSLAMAQYGVELEPVEEVTCSAKLSLQYPRNTNTLLVPRYITIISG